MADTVTPASSVTASVTASPSAPAPKGVDHRLTPDELKAVREQRAANAIDPQPPGAPVFLEKLAFIARGCGGRKVPGMNAGAWYFDTEQAQRSCVIAVLAVEGVDNEAVSMDVDTAKDGTKQYIVAFDVDPQPGTLSRHSAPPPDAGKGASTTTTTTTTTAAKSPTSTSASASKK